MRARGDNACSELAGYLSLDVAAIDSLLLSNVSPTCGISSDAVKKGPGPWQSLLLHKREVYR